MKRTLLLGTAWTASAASAVGLGFLAVSLVDASATPGSVPLAAASTGTVSDDDGSPAASPAAAPTTPTGTKATLAGTVSASCTSGSLIVSGAPATGWWIDDSNDGEVEFENGTQKLEVTVTCVDGSPRFSVEGPRPDNSGGDDDGEDGDGSVAPAPVTDAPDDSDGRDGGGHGDDDPAGDDSRGRNGGGHGGDDDSDNSGSGSNNSGSGSDNSGKGGSGSDDSDSGSDDSGGGSGGHGSDD
jgi:hypothetical protein